MRPGPPGLARKVVQRYPRATEGQGFDVPIYEYRCQACGRAFEMLVFSTSPRVSCPSCGADDVKRTPSTFGIGGSAKGTSSGASCSGCSRSSCAGCR
jgi:putative FmdB family regulatory protein